MLRLRQLVLAATDLGAAVADLRGVLAAAEPYRDPGVATFGLVNAVLAAGGDFVEVVSPSGAGTAVSRWIERHGGDGGYMLMVDGPPGLLDRTRLAELDVRVVHEVVLPDVTDLHLHPKDVGGVVLALDTVDPPGSWRWAGPSWTPPFDTGHPPYARGGLRSVVLAVDDPLATAQRWAAVLDLPLAGDTRLHLDGGQAVQFVERAGPGAGPGAGPHAGLGIVAATITLPVSRPTRSVVAGVTFDVIPLEEPA